MREASAALEGPALGVDLGRRRIGVALSDSAGTLAVPYEVIERGPDPAEDRRRLAELAREVMVRTVDVGLPLSWDGTAGPAARAAEAERRALALELEPAGVAVVSVDERLSTVSATAALARSGVRGRRARRRVDSAAAAVLLQSWLDAEAHRRVRPAEQGADKAHGGSR